jgi:hypothetical protein
VECNAGEVIAIGNKTRHCSTAGFFSSLVRAKSIGQSVAIGRHFYGIFRHNPVHTINIISGAFGASMIHAPHAKLRGDERYNQR